MWQKVKQKLLKPDEHTVQNDDIENDLKGLNEKFKHVLSSQEEQIVYRPILAEKIKPDKSALVNVFQKNGRYLLFTNKKLYTLEPEVYNEGSIDGDKLIINKIDAQYLSHIVFIPQFEFATFEYLDPSRLSSSSNLINEFKRKEVEMIIKFNDEIAEGDIALKTEFMTLL